MNPNNKLQTVLIEMVTNEKFKSWIIFLFAVLLYANTIGNEYVVDDSAMITDNKTTKQGFSGMARFFKESSVYGATGENFGTYRPITMALFAFEYAIYNCNSYSGINKPAPVGQRITHIVLYGICCVLLFKFLSYLLHNFNSNSAFKAALLFAAHPLHTEVGAMIKSRDEILSAILLFLSLSTIIKYAKSDKTQHLFFSYLFYFVSMFCKESAVVFIAIIPMTLYFFMEFSVWRCLKIVSGLMFFALIYFYIRLSVLDPIPNNTSIINNTLAGASSVSQKIATILYVGLYNFKLLILPYPLSWEYGYNQIPLKTFYDSAVIFSLILNILLLAIAFYGLKRKTVYSFFYFWYFITIFLVSNIVVLIPAILAERFFSAFCFILCHTNFFNN
ncbi:MAG: DUF1736 domain-containing protein [Bacteroidetes bacterium]|nr:DUF1736 domain-containing protein [Bacteroidota bacterium]